MRNLILLLFAVTGGLALSGMVANLYRLLGRKPAGRASRAFYCTVMIFAGPSVLIQNATTSFRKKSCSKAAYAFALGLGAYWSFALGFALISLSEVI